MKKRPVAIVTDLHLHEHVPFSTWKDGYNSRLLDGRDVMLHVFRVMKKKGVRDLLFGGDWFHSRRKVSVAVLHVSKDILEQAKSMGIRVHAFPGNHDFSLDGASCSITGQPFHEVWEDPGVYNIAGHLVGVIPWTEEPDVVQGVCALDADFFAGHLGVSGSLTGPSDFELQGGMEIDDFGGGLKNRPVFLGHYHKPQTLRGTNIHYVGSPLQLSWGERGEDKRFIIYHGKGSFESIPLDVSPRFMRVTEKTLSDCRPNDFVEVVVPKQKDVKRVQRLLETSRSGSSASIRVSGVAEISPCRMDVSGLPMQKQVESYIEYAGVPENVTKDELLQVAAELLA